MKIDTCNLVYNAAAHFAAMDRYGDGLINAITQKGLAGFDALCWALEELSTQGELIRRDMGYDHAEPIKSENAKKYLRPTQILSAKQAVINAILGGLSIGDDDTQEVDEVLLELQKKTEDG